MVEIEPWVVVGALGTIIGLIITLIAIWHNNKTMKKGLENLTELVELQKQRNVTENYRLELEQKEKETKDAVRKISLGMKLFDFIISHIENDDEIIEEEIEG